jgi:HSP20 family protein
MGWRSWNGPVDKEVMIETLTWPMETPGSGGGGELLVRWRSQHGSALGAAWRATMTASRADRDPADQERGYQGTRGQRERQETGWPDPAGLMRRFGDEMERLFERFGRVRDWPWGRFQEGTWAPDIEVLRRGDHFILRADLPGLKKEDITVEIRENAVTISGERRRDQAEAREEPYRSERRYGSFHRVIPLPEEAQANHAKATFKDGVLEIAMPEAPRGVPRGRRIDIEDEPGPDAPRTNPRTER